MRTSWWACIVVAVLTCSVTYRYINRPSSPVDSLPADSAESFEQAEQRPLEQKPELPLSYPELPLTYKDDARVGETRVQDIDPAPAGLEPDRVRDVQKEARLEDPAATVPIEHSAPSDTRQNLSYLAYYAYSELPPPIKPAVIVLDALKGIPPGTPIEEIKRVSAILGLDFTFMKTVAKIESGFDPKQRTGSYIGLFQLSKKEFEKYGSGNILASRDNAVAAALKFMTENTMFQMFTQKKPTLYDVYLIHQQGVDGATEHVTHPHRLAWRSMCATEEGKEKGEKWCKRAIWGNTLPALKRVWKNVNNVTSAAFVAMWQQRVSHFYARYSEAAAN